MFERFVLRDVLNGPGPEIEDDELSFPGEHRDRDAYYNVEPILRTDVVVTPAVISDDDSGDFVEPVLRRVRLNRARNNSQSGRGT